MKNFLLLAGAAAIISSATAAPSHIPSALKLPARVGEPVESKWLASMQNIYYWVGEWELGDENVYTYTPEGLVAVENTTEWEYGELVGFTRTTNTYNANGNLAERTIEVSSDGENFTPSQRTIIEYDPVLTNVIIANDQLLWFDGQEVKMGNNYRRKIFRNYDGNISYTEISVWFNGMYDPTEMLQVEYGSDGRADALILQQLEIDYENNGYKWTITDEYRNVKWDATDGQIYSLDYIYQGANRIKSADIYEDEEMVGTLNVDYTTDGGYDLHLAGKEGEYTFEGLVQYRPLPNDGYSYSLSVTYDDGDSYATTEVCEYTPTGLISRLYESEIENGVLLSEVESRGIIEGPDDRPDAYEYYSRYEPDSEWEPEIRIEFNDYAQYAGVENVVASPVANGEPVYYNLQGVRVTNPSKGIYIERRGDISRKVRLD